MLERCPAFVIDYAHHIELPDDITPEELSEFGYSLEYRYFFMINNLANLFIVTIQRY